MQWFCPNLTAWQHINSRHWCSAFGVKPFWSIIQHLQHRLHPAGKRSVSKRLWESFICCYQWHHACSSLCDRDKKVDQKAFTVTQCRLFRVPLGVIAVVPRCLRQARQPDTASTVLQLCWNCWHLAQFTTLILILRGLWPGEWGRTFLKGCFWSKGF